MMEVGTKADTTDRWLWPPDRKHGRPRSGVVEKFFSLEALPCSSSLHHQGFWSSPCFAEQRDGVSNFRDATVLPTCFHSCLFFQSNGWAD